MGLGEKGEGIKQSKNPPPKENPNSQTDRGMLIGRGEGGGDGRKVKGGKERWKET